MFKIPKLSTILLSVIALFLLAVATPETNAARTSDIWQERFGTYIETSWDEGRDILINGANKYLNFGTDSGSAGYGIRDNAGTIECKNDGGSWSACQDGGGGGGGTPGGSDTQVQFNNSGSFAGDFGFTYSSSTDILSVVSINATNSTTTRLAVTGTGTSTFAGGINTGANMIISHGGQADASDGWYLNAGNGTQIGLFGAGNTSNALFYGALNIDGNTRIATTTNGVLVANAGAITASGTPYVTSIVATGTTATSTFAGAVGIGTTTPLSLLTVQGTANITSNLQVNGGTLFANATNNRVGIGTLTPARTLSVVDSAGVIPMSIQNTSASAYSGIHFVNSSGSTAGHMGYANASVAGTLANKFYFGSILTKDLVLTTDDTIRMTLKTSTGNVGIGTTTPQGKLDVLTNTNGGNLMYLTNTNTGTGAYNELNIRNAGHASDDGLRLLNLGTAWTTTGAFVQDSGMINAGGNLSGGLSVVSQAGDTRFYTGGFATGNERMRITSGGSVGIGTTTPHAMLSIMGTSTSPIARITTSSGLELLKMLSTGSTTANGTWDFSGATVKQHEYRSFPFPSFYGATTTSATTTMELGTAYTNEQWVGADCKVTSGSGAFIFTDGTNRMNGATATTTVSRTTLSTNNTFTAQESRYVEIGPLTNARLVCTVDIIVNN